MKSVRATWQNGQIIPDGPLDWPDGCRLHVEREDSPDEPFMVDEDQWSDTSEAFDEWLRWCDRLGWMTFPPEEETESTIRSPRLGDRTFDSLFQCLEEPWG